MSQIPKISSTLGCVSVTCFFLPSAMVDDLMIFQTCLVIVTTEYCLWNLQSFWLILYYSRKDFVFLYEQWIRTGVPRKDLHVPRLYFRFSHWTEELVKVLIRWRQKKDFKKKRVCREINDSYVIINRLMDITVTDHPNYIYDLGVWFKRGFLCV